LDKKFKERQEKQAKESQEKPPKPSKSEKIRPSPVSWIVFFFTISMVLISLVPVVFPPLITTSFTTVSDLKQFGVTAGEVNPFETGQLAVPLFLTSAIIFGLAILYFKNKLPEYLSKIFTFIFDFEISKKIAFVAIVVILAVYIAASAHELSEPQLFEDYIGVKDRVEKWSPDQILGSFEPHVRYFFLSSSLILFGNDAIIPFIASITLLITVYFFTKKITQKRFAGLVAMAILLQSNLFLYFDTTVAYTNFWVLLFLLSLYFMYNVWPLSPLMYIFSIFSKALTIMFLPMFIYFLLRSSISRKKKMIIACTTIAIVIIGAFYSSNTDLVVVQDEPFLANEFWIGFASFAAQLRFDWLVILFLVPLTVGLFLMSEKNKHSESIMVLIAGMLLAAPILTGFTDQTNQPYRFMPLITFFAVGVGVLLSKRTNLLSLKKSKLE